MATIEQYQAGWVSKVVRGTVTRLRRGRRPIHHPALLCRITEELEELQPRRLSLAEAAQLIRASRVCAIGDRMCHAAFPESPTTTAVFLDDLAEGLIVIGRATRVTPDGAIRELAAQPNRPLVITRVDGRESEICPTFPARCVYWTMLRRGHLGQGLAVRFLARLGQDPSRRSPHRLAELVGQRGRVAALLGPLGQPEAHSR